MVSFIRKNHILNLHKNGWLIIIVRAIFFGGKNIIPNLHQCGNHSNEFALSKFKLYNFHLDIIFKYISENCPNLNILKLTQGCLLEKEVLMEFFRKDSVQNHSYKILSVEDNNIDNDLIKEISNIEEIFTDVQEHLVFNISEDKEVNEEKKAEEVQLDFSNNLIEDEGALQILSKLNQKNKDFTIDLSRNRIEFKDDGWRDLHDNNRKLKVGYVIDPNCSTALKDKKLIVQKSLKHDFYNLRYIIFSFYFNNELYLALNGLDLNDDDLDILKEMLEKYPPRQECKIDISNNPKMQDKKKTLVSLVDQQIVKKESIILFSPRDYEFSWNENTRTITIKTTAENIHTLADTEKKLYGHQNALKIIQDLYKPSQICITYMHKVEPKKHAYEIKEKLEAKEVFIKIDEIYTCKQPDPQP